MKSIKHICTFALFALFLTTNMQAARTRSQANKQQKEEQQESEAAAKIQALFRGHSVRKRNLNAKIFRLLKKEPEETCHFCAEEYNSEKTRIILFCCKHQACKECIKKIEQPTCPFCKQGPIRYLNTRNLKVSSLPFILSHNFSLTFPTNTFPLDFHYTQEELTDVILKTNSCDGIAPWILPFTEQLKKSDAKHLVELLKEKTGRSYE